MVGLVLFGAVVEEASYETGLRQLASNHNEVYGIHADPEY